MIDYSCSQVQDEVVVMEIRVRGSLKSRALTNLGTFLRRVTSIQMVKSRQSIPIEMFAANCLPYEASRTYQTIMADFECERSRAQAEARMAFRSI